MPVTAQCRFTSVLPTYIVNLLNAKFQVSGTSSFVINNLKYVYIFAKIVLFCHVQENTGGRKYSLGCCRQVFHIFIFLYFGILATFHHVKIPRKLNIKQCLI